MVIILLPLFNAITHFWKFERKDENRRFTDSCSIDINNLDVFPKNYENYINDNFSFRTPLLNLYHDVKFYFYKVSPHPDKTIIGKDGWYFMAGREKESYEGKIDFSDVQMKQFDKEWTNRKKYFDSMNIKMYWVICPMKYNIYPEMLPFNEFRGDKKGRVEKLLEHLQKKFSDIITNPAPALILAKDSMKVFYKLDDHWNERGGFVASQILLSKIKLDFPEIKIKSYSDYIWK
jgi:alginate O-acetyltransferase complex protein AlgJ